MTESVLLVEDDRLKRLALTREMQEAGFLTVACENGYEAVRAVEEQDFFLAVTDLRLPGMDGLALLRKIKEVSPETSVIVVTAYGSVDTAVEALRSGAYDYLIKPVSYQELAVKIEHLLDRRRMVRTIEELRAAVKDRFEFGQLVGSSKEMREVFERARIVAATDTPVLIQGETGTGKELLARAIHHASPRRDKPFVAFNCAIFNPNLLESELFGHEAGAFTGATRPKRGRFELAGDGSVFLDDIDDLPADSQVKLLRVLQEKRFERVGGEKSLPMAARVVCASKVDLRERARKGGFREDLLYRIDVVRIGLPPLRERKGDLPLLFHHLWQRAGGEPGPLDPEVLRSLIAHDWPGNIRELENVVLHTRTFAGTGPVTPACLPEYLGRARRPDRIWSVDLSLGESINLPTVLDEIERECIRWALVKAGGNESRAADLLNLPRTTLRRRRSDGAPAGGVSPSPASE